MALLLQLTQKLAHGFMAFYQRYPRKEARKDAVKAWGQVVNDDPVIEEQIHAALDWQIPLYEQRERNFIPLPASYLRGERWTDEPPTPPKPKTAPVVLTRHSQMGLEPRPAPSPELIARMRQMREEEGQ